MSRPERLGEESSRRIAPLMAAGTCSRLGRRNIPDDPAVPESLVLPRPSLLNASRTCARDQHPDVAKAASPSRPEHEPCFRSTEFDPSKLVAAAQELRQHSSWP